MNNIYRFKLYFKFTLFYDLSILTLIGTSNNSIFLFGIMVCYNIELFLRLKIKVKNNTKMDGI